MSEFFVFYVDARRYCLHHFQPRGLRGRCRIPFAFAVEHPRLSMYQTILEPVLALGAEIFSVFVEQESFLKPFVSF